MMWILESILLFIAVTISLPTLILFVEIVAAFFPRDRKLSSIGFAGSKSIAIIVPAHNESSGIARTLADISGQLAQGDSLVVVADNCTDDTAAVATACGAKVVVRKDEARRGKGYALAFGLEFLAARKPDIVIAVDADCRVNQDAIRNLAATCMTSNRPVQAFYVMEAPAGHESRFAVAKFAWILRNQVRPSGLAKLGLPCQMMGTGMAFPWAAIQSINLASSNIVEDLELGINLTRSGHPPEFCMDARVESQFPVTGEGIIKQRRRWEQGSLAMLLRIGVQTCYEAVRRRNGPLLALGLDMMVPPMVVHAFVTLLAMMALGILYLAGACSGLPPAIVTLSGFLFATSLLLAWLGFGRIALPVSHLKHLIPYLLAKLKIYQGFGSRTPPEWVRSDRSEDK